MRPSSKPNQLSAFAVTALGLEAICVAELRALGIAGTAVPGGGGVEWAGDLDSVMRANLWLRTASRVLVRIAEFKATAFFELELNAKKIPWKRFLAPNSSAEFRVTARKSKLYHTGAIAQRLGDALTRSVKGATVAAAKAGDGDDEDVPRPENAQLFVVRFTRDVATISIDASGELLHRRGYRQAVAKAPLRETLAAAILLGSGWDGSTALTDPMCGSGTIPIEGAMIARRMAPGRDRRFAFMTWPDFDRAAWERMLAAARAGELEKSPVAISGFDRDAGAITAARANAERAGVAGDVELAVQPVSAMPAQPGPGLVASNPPYGVRVGESDALRNLYAQAGNVLRARRPGWTFALLSADRALERQTGFEFRERFATKNGGINVRLVTTEVQPQTRESGESC